MERKIFFMSKGKHISAIVSSPSKKTKNARKAIILIHGFKGNKEAHGNFTAAAKTFCNAGFLVVRFDCMGNGESDGKTTEFTLQTCVQNTIDAVAFARALGAKHVALLGHSLGGEIAVLAAEKTKASALVLWAPVTQSSFWKTRFSEGEVKSFLKKGFARMYGKMSNRFVAIGKGFFLSVLNTKVENTIATMRTPLLIIHGDKDYNVPIVQSQYSLSLAKGKKKLVTVKNADHHFFEQKKLFIAESLRWFKKYM